MPDNSSQSPDKGQQCVPAHWAWLPVTAQKRSWSALTTVLLGLQGAQSGSDPASGLHTGGWGRRMPRTRQSMVPGVSLGRDHGVVSLARLHPSSALGSAGPWVLLRCRCQEVQQVQLKMGLKQ